MTDLDSLHPPGAPPAPVPRAPTTWPLVLGILGLVFGIGGVLVYGCFSNLGMAMIFLFEDMLEQASANQPSMELNAVQLEVVRTWAPFSMAANSLVGLVAVVLIVGSVKLLRRRSGARRTCLTWAVLRITVSIPAATVGYLLNRAQFEAMEDAATGQASAFAGMFGILQGFGWLGVAFGLLWAWAFPVFLIVWFSRSAIREEVANW